MVGKFIAANVDGSMNCDSKTGIWCASEIKESTGVDCHLKINFFYKGKNGSFYKDAIISKHKFYQICESIEDAERICKSNNTLIRGRKMDRKLIKADDFFDERQERELDKIENMWP